MALKWYSKRRHWNNCTFFNFMMIAIFLLIKLYYRKYKFKENSWRKKKHNVYENKIEIICKMSECQILSLVHFKRKFWMMNWIPVIWKQRKGVICVCFEFFFYLHFYFDIYDENKKFYSSSEVQINLNESQCVTLNIRNPWLFSKICLWNLFSHSSKNKY